MKTLRLIRAIKFSLWSILLATGCTSTPPSNPELTATETATLVVSGDAQKGVVATELARPVVVRVLRNGRPVNGATVNFVVTTAAETPIVPDAGPDGTVSPTGFVRTADPFNGTVFAGAVVTNANGIAQDFWTLGTRTDVPQQLQARTVDAATGKQVFATFTATALPGPGFYLVRSSPNAPGIVSTNPTPGSTLHPGASVLVRDRYSNTVPGVAIQFAISAGGGSCSPTTAMTGADGAASTDWTLGLGAITANTLTATASGLVYSPQMFTIFTGCPASDGGTADAGATDAGTGLAICYGKTDGGFGPGCVDLQNDPNNCGSCSLRCPSSATCRSGLCQCPTGQTPCGGRCVDLQNDPTDCGACFNYCPGGAVCSAGACQCQAGQTFCGASDGGKGGGGFCADTQTDRSNCGSCSTSCSGMTSCVAGVCACYAGQTLCGNLCVDLQSDPGNCGGCSTVCPGAAACTAGHCTTCPAGKTACGTSCVDLQNDGSNCGACFAGCPGGAYCSKGSCACRAGTSLCGGNCLDLQNDPNNCGACANICPAGSICAAGACTACATGQTACGNTCADLQSDANNCGACFSYCSGGMACSAGQCACPIGQVLCGGQCVDLQNDPGNCGTCANSCAAGESCQGGKCSCPADAILCTGFGCVYPRWDPQHCGGCAPCPGDQLVCSWGVCHSCVDEGFTRCANTCVNTASDDNNCGACGVRCGVNATCLNGACLSGM